MKLLKNVICIMLANACAFSLHAAEPRKAICPVRPIAAKKACEASLAQQAAQAAQRRHTIAVIPVKKAGAGIGMIPPLAPMSSFPTVESLFILKDQKQSLLVQATAEQKKVLHNQIAQIDAELKSRQMPALKPVVKQAEAPLMPLPPLRAIPFKAGLIKMKLGLAVKRGEVKSDARKKEIDAQIAQIDAEIKRRGGISLMGPKPKRSTAAEKASEIRISEAQVKPLVQEFIALSENMEEMMTAELYRIAFNLMQVYFEDADKMEAALNKLFNKYEGYIESKGNEFLVALGLPTEEVKPIGSEILPEKLQPFEESLKRAISKVIDGATKQVIAIKAKFLANFPEQQRQAVWSKVRETLASEM